MMLRVSSIAALALILGFSAADDGHAQEYPAKPIRLIISSSPGSGVDTIARAVAQRMSEALGVQIIPDNRAGGGGTIGVQAVAKAPADGYTLLMGAPSFTVNAMLVKPPPYEFPRDFAAIGQATTAPYIVVVHPSLPVKSVKELIALARARPGQLNFGSGGTGNSTHLTGEYFKHLTQTNIVHIPYKGSGPAVADLLGGHIQLMFANLVAVLPNVKSGKLRGLATTGAVRPRALPDLPTVVEAGVPGYVMTSWFGLLAPARTPPEAITKLNGVLVKVMQERDMAEKVAADGAEPAPSRPDEFARLIAAELKVWGQIIRIANVQPER
jgi:tripartite-type tricarboxylate transporter receptor subunit TctC